MFLTEFTSPYSQRQLLVTQTKIIPHAFHASEISVFETFKIFKIVLFIIKWGKNHFFIIILIRSVCVLAVYTVCMFDAFVVLARYVNINLLKPELFFLNLVHPVYKM